MWSRQRLAAHLDRYANLDLTVLATHVCPSTSQSIFPNVEAAQEHVRTVKCVFLANVSATWSNNPIPKESLVVLELEAPEHVYLEC